MKGSLRFVPVVRMERTGLSTLGFRMCYLTNDAIFPEKETLQRLYFNSAKTERKQLALSASPAANTSRPFARVPTITA